MSYRLSIPTKNVERFEIYRYAFSTDDVQVFIGEDQYETSTEELKLWLRDVGVDMRMIEKIVDWLWNMRRIKFDLAEQRMTIPEDQSNPFEGPDIVDIDEDILPPMTPYGSIPPFWSM